MWSAIPVFVGIQGDILDFEASNIVVYGFKASVVAAFVAIDDDSHLRRMLA
jgi:hypothetical protein